MPVLVLVVGLITCVLADDDRTMVIGGFIFLAGVALFAARL